MGIRDREIDRILKYAAGLGIKVEFIARKRGAGAAEWDNDPPCIRVYGAKHISKVNLICCLLHELGHHMDWIEQKRKVSDEVVKAYAQLNQGHMFGTRPDLTSTDTAVILCEEMAAVTWMGKLYEILQLTFPLYKLREAQLLDVYAYHILHRKNRFPTAMEYYTERQRIRRSQKKGRKNGHKKSTR